MIKNILEAVKKVKMVKMKEILLPAVKILIILISVILVIFLLKYLYQTLNSVLEIKPVVLESRVINFEIEKLEKFSSRLGIEIIK